MRNSLCVIFLAGVLGFSSAAAALVEPEKITSSAGDGSYTIDNAAQTEDINILEAREILALSDEKLVDAYIDASVEIEAAKAFHSTSGFNPKQYKKYKALLKYRIQLLFEIHRRKIETPPTLN